jgi:hypothetical protein
MPVRAQGVVPGEQAAAQLAQLQAQVSVRVGQVAALKEPVLAVALRHLRQREQDLHHRILNTGRCLLHHMYGTVQENWKIIKV